MFFRWAILFLLLVLSLLVLSLYQIPQKIPAFFTKNAWLQSFAALMTLITIAGGIILKMTNWANSKKPKSQSSNGINIHDTKYKGEKNKASVKGKNVNISKTRFKGKENELEVNSGSTKTTIEDTHIEGEGNTFKVG